MILTNFLKRLESSARSLVLTLGRTVDKINRLIERIDQFQITQQTAMGVSAEVLPDDDEDDEDFFVNQGQEPLSPQRVGFGSGGVPICWKTGRCWPQPKTR